MTGPRELKAASALRESTAPTVIGSCRFPGLAMVLAFGPKLPAAKTGTTPARIRLAVGSANSVTFPGNPSDIETIFAPSSVAGLPSGSSTHCIPAITCANVPAPSGSTSAESSLDSGATPTLEPAIKPAVCVPWLLVSCGFAPTTRSPLASNSANASSRPASSGCVASMPVSRCPTRTPAPLNPAAQAWAAPTRSRCQGVPAGALPADCAMTFGMRTAKFSKIKSTLEIAPSTSMALPGSRTSTLESSQSVSLVSTTSLRP